MQDIDALPELTPKILWSCIARNDTILVEAGEDEFDGKVIETAQGLLARKPTPGYEFHQVRKMWPQRNNDKYGPRLRGCKFHLYEHDTDHVDVALIWVFAAVYDTTLVDQKQVQSFLEKMVTLTEHLRAEQEEWRNGTTLACQEGFAPILEQRMDQVTYLGKIAMLEEQLETSRAIMNKNIDMLLEREEKLQNEVKGKSDKLNDMSKIFRKRAKKVRRLQMLQNAKHGIVLGTMVTAGVAIAVVPPLVVLL